MGTFLISLKIGTGLDENAGSKPAFSFGKEFPERPAGMLWVVLITEKVVSPVNRGMHMRTAAILFFMALAAPSFGQVQAQAPTPAPGTAPPSLVRAGVTEMLTPRVWAIPDGSAPLVPNVGIVVGRKAVLVIDTGMGTRNAQTVLAEVAKVGAGKPIYIVTTHVHPEHDMGAHAFPAGSKLIRSKDQVEDIAAGAGTNLVPVFAARSELNRELLAGAKHRDADIVFDERYVLDLGGVKAEIYAMGTNHTHGDTVVHVDTVLFSGDVAMKPQPSFANPTATMAHWLASLDKLEALKPAHIVPSHGPFGGVEIIAGYRVYLTRIRDRAVELKNAGKSVDETVQIVTDEMSAQYPDKNRLGGAIRAAYSN
jgi:glyoxylase-like metal-dependent hydrolase (beta-lactamase superfamily II)